MLLEDDQMTMGFKKPVDVNEDMIKELKKYLNKRKCAYYVKLISMTIYNNRTYEPLEPEHFCVIIKPTDKFVHDKDTYQIFEIMKPYLTEESDFVDFSVLGHYNTIQIADDQGMGYMVY